MYCSKCEVDISDSYEEADYDCGILSGGWYCDDCDEFYSDTDYEEDCEED